MIRRTNYKPRRALRLSDRFYAWAARHNLIVMDPKPEYSDWDMKDGLSMNGKRNWPSA